MFKKMFLLFVLSTLSISCFAARCLSCGRNLMFADEDCVCNQCLARSAIRRKVTTASWEINYKSNLAKPNICYIIYSAKDSFQNRQDAVYISDEGRLCQIHNSYFKVGENILKMPQGNNPDRVNICFYYTAQFQGGYQTINMFHLTNMPLTVKDFDYLKFEVGIQNDRSLCVEIWGGKHRYDGFTLVGRGSMGANGKLDCSSL